MPKKRSLDKPIEQPKEAPTLPPFRTDDYNPNKVKIMWGFVIPFALLIAVVWGWSLKQQIATFQWNTTPEVKLVSDAQTKWNEIYKQQVDQDNAYRTAKNTLQKLIQSAVATNTTTSEANAPTTTASSTALSNIPTTTKKK